MLQGQKLKNIHKTPLLTYYLSSGVDQNITFRLYLFFLLHLVFLYTFMTSNAYMLKTLQLLFKQLFLEYLQSISLQAFK